jgi:ATP-dependent protease Clp ATPase subunit
MIMEEILIEPMYVLPSQKRIKELTITTEIVEKKRSVFEALSEVEKDVEILAA